MARAWFDTELDWWQKRPRLRRLARRTTQRLGWLWRPLRRRLWPGAPSGPLLVLVFIAVVLAAFLPLLFVKSYAPANRLCDENGLWCGLGIHILGTGLVAALGYYFVFLRREAKTARNSRKRARRKPEQLFSWLAPRTDVSGIIGRERLVIELARGLDEGAGPSLIVGDTGSGKTMVLVSLTKLLAKQGQVTVPLSLRDVDGSLDFEEQARKAFVNQIKAEVRSREEADKVWRWLRRREVITVLADNLEKVDATPADIVRALEVAHRERLRLVVASRTDGVPPDLEESVIALEPLNDEDVIRHIAERLTRARGWNDKRLDEAKREIEPVVRQAEIGDTPYYIRIAAGLAENDTLPRVPATTTTDARRLLLDSYREAVIERTLLPEAGFSTGERRHLLEALEVVAYARLHGAKDEAALRASVRELEGQGGKAFDVRLTVENGKRLGLLEVQDDGEVRFGHPTTLAYFAARFLSAHTVDQTLWRSLIDETPAMRTLTLAIVLANASAQDAAFAKATCEALVDQAKDPYLKTDADSEGSERLSLITAAAEAATAAKLSDDGVVSVRSWRSWRARPTRSVVAEITEGARRERARAGLLAKLGAIPALSALGTDPAYGALWEYASADEDYSVRRAATKALVDGGVSAFAAIGETIRECLEEVESLPLGTKLVTDQQRDLLGRLKVLGWTLPSIRTAFASTGAATDVPEEFMRRLDRIDGVRVDTQRGLEAAIAQGLKLDAMREPLAAVDPLALSLLDPSTEREGGPAKFWFSRVLLVQAIARRCVERADDARARALIELAERDAHPYVREAAGFCKRALSRLRGEWSKYIWEDLTQVVSRTPQGLVIETTQLVADIVIALNLNEQKNDELREAFCEAAELPHCLSLSKNRAELLGTQDGPPTCVFASGDGGGCQLCPYEFSMNRPARRELSKAFCRHQRLAARPLRWHPSMSTAALKQFWGQMEIRARM